MTSSQVAQLSSNNPFRTPVVTPNPTGASPGPTSAPSYATLPPIATSSGGASSASSLPPNYSDLSQIGPPSDDEESPEALPELTPRISSPRPPSNGRPPSLPPRNDSHNRSPSTTTPSLPPRPSSRATDLPPPSGTPPSLSADSFPEAAPPPAYSLTPDVGSGERLVQQGPRRPFQRAPEPFLQVPALQTQGPEPGQQLQSPPPFAPPPGAPPGRVPPSPSSERPQSQLSDFAQDFYNAGTTTSPRDEQQRQPQYAPPPGAPPPPRPRAASSSSGAGSTTPPTGNGRPTTTPTPGHPLLRNGQTLVYPENHSCPKCHNTGYKNYDPSHPCRKCWDRFGKPFTSILSSSPWGGQTSMPMSQSQRGRTFQQPLPALRPPQTRAPPPPPPPPPPIPGAYPSPTGPRPGMQQGNTGVRAAPFGAVPPPGATVVMPGDPRIGGRLCWRCGGRGTTPFLIFDELTCETCGGVGRLIN